MSYPWSTPGTVSLGNIYGPSAGASNAERTSVAVAKSSGRVPSVLTLPVVIALGVLVWYAVREYN